MYTIYIYIYWIYSSYLQLLVDLNNIIKYIHIASKQAVPTSTFSDNKKGLQNSNMFQHVAHLFACGQVAPPLATSWLWTGAEIASAQASSGDPHGYILKTWIKLECFYGNLRSVAHGIFLAVQKNTYLGQLLRQLFRIHSTFFGGFTGVAFVWQPWHVLHRFRPSVQETPFEASPPRNCDLTSGDDAKSCSGNCGDDDGLPFSLAVADPWAFWQGHHGFEKG